MGWGFVKHKALKYLAQQQKFPERDDKLHFLNEFPARGSVMILTNNVDRWCTIYKRVTWGNAARWVSQLNKGTGVAACSSWAFQQMEKAVFVSHVPYTQLPR